jgi:aspartate/methionine/tyrosine aminotransferase
VRYNLPINSTRLVHKLRDEASVLIVPGDHFGLDHYLRISFGLPHDYLSRGLDRIHQVIQDIRSEAA